MKPGKSHQEKEWWYYNKDIKQLQKVPDGLIPEIDAQYLDMDAPF